jgi:chromodomain-helicase-DNA-binding protein 4
MSEGPSDDLALLFTPPRTPVSSALSEIPPTPRSESSVAPKARQTITFYIEPPVLSLVEKSQYRTLPVQFVLSGVESPDVDSIIGEYREGTDLYYFARFQDGIAHKVCDSYITRVPLVFTRVF